jgi:hypothetical protein
MSFELKKQVVIRITSEQDCDRALDEAANNLINEVINKMKEGN